MRRRVFLLGASVFGAVPHLACGQAIGEGSMRFVDRQGIRLATETFGAQGNPPVLLIMGATASMLGWPDELCRDLARRGFHVIRFDHRDTGLSTTSPPGAGGYAVEDMAADVVAILDAYGLARAHLVGMSLGGYIAQMIAVDRPDRVETLTLIASEPLGWDGAPLPHISDDILSHFGHLADLDWSRGEDVTDFFLELERLMAGTGTAFDPEATRGQIARVLARTDSIASAFNHSTVALSADWTGRFREIAQPTLVIHGEEDPVLPVANGRAIAAGVAGAVLDTLPGVGHELPAGWIAHISRRIGDHIRS